MVKTACEFLGQPRLIPGNRVLQLIYSPSDLPVIKFGLTYKRFGRLNLSPFLLKLFDATLHLINIVGVITADTSSGRIQIL